MNDIIKTIVALLLAIRADKKLSSKSAKSTDCTIKIRRLKSNTIRIDMIPIPATPSASPFK